MSPDQGPVARFSAAPGTAGTATNFNGSTSSDADGAVARYDWSFGDGSSAPNAGPSPAHVYSAPGTYTVTLTVADDIGCSTAFIFNGHMAYCSGGPAAQTSAQVMVRAKDTTAPKLTALSLSPTAFAAAKSGPSAAAKRVGTKVKYRVSEAGVTTFTVEHPARGVKRGRRCVKPGKGAAGNGKRCTRYVRLPGSFSHKNAAGRNQLRFRGRLHRRALRPGHYRLVATPRDTAGNKGKPTRRAFRIVR